MPEASLSRRRLVAGAAALPLFGILTRRAAAAEFVYKLATGQDPNHPVNIRAQQAIDRIREASGGRLEIRLFPANQLGADTDLLAQVLINLLQNAAQAMAGQDRPPRLALRLFPDREALVIEVEDNGPGVPEGLRQDVFLPFFTTRATGTGVGLNLARQIVVAHGGTIAISDAPGGGAVFRIVL